ncbi:MAG: trimethylamine methyltransferase family protein [Candidatus Eremiobacteraeota bacterium]|nr:trimethylamine methyltransferase family protein [Candidatus Eremiobacteraeota bacterium]
MSKHLVTAPASVESAQGWLEVAEILAGDRTLNEHPIITFCVPITTPLCFDETNCHIMKMGVRKGIPIEAQTEPIAGATAPLSFAGGLLMGNAENLFLIIMAQLLKPGAPITYSIGHGLTDLHTGNAIFYNADKMLWQIADIQMANFYNIPNWSSLSGSMVGRYDVQCGIEQALLMMPTVASGTNILNGLGSCFNACGMSAEMIVIQADLAQLIERISDGIDITDEKLDFDSISAVGPGGHFLTEALTIKMLRSDEFFTKGSFDRSGERSSNDPKDSMLVRAHERVEELLAAHEPAVCGKTAEEIHRWCRQREK